MYTAAGEEGGGGGQQRVFLGDLKLFAKEQGGFAKIGGRRVLIFYPLIKKESVILWIFL